MTELTIYEPSQSVYGLQEQHGQEARHRSGQVRVVSPFVGGGFRREGGS